MSDNDLPDIPSFEELGISPEELKELEKELEEGPDDSTDPEGAPAPPPSSGPVEGGGGKGPGTPPKDPTPAAVSPPPPWGGLRGPLSLVFLILVAWLSSANRAVPRPVPVGAPDSVFSAERAMEHLSEIARAAHPPGSPEHERVRGHLLTELRRLGLDPSVQTTTSLIGRGSYVRGATVRNIVARIPGTDSQGAVLVTAHYDGRELAKAAGDDGSGVVAILESIRALRAGAPLRNDLIVLLTDGEELGLLGARAFVDEHPWMEDVALVVSIEMRGGGGPSIMFETGANSGWIVEQYGQVATRPVATSLAYEIYKRMPNDTDFTPFKEAGKQGLNFAAIGRAPVYHQTYDSPENLSPGTVQHHGSQALAVLRHLGNADLATVDAPDPVYFTVPILGLVVYPGWWVWALGVAGVLLWVLALALVRRGGGQWKGVVSGLVGALVVVGATAGVGHYLYVLRLPAHPEVGALHGSAFHSEGWYVLAIVALGALLFGLVFALLRKWFTVGELSVGSLLLPLLAGWALAITAPLGAMVLQWPVVGGLIGAAAVAGLARHDRPGPIRWVILLLAALPVVALLAPLLELLWLSMSLALGVALGALAAMVFVLLLPLLDVARTEPNRWWLHLASVVLAGLFLGLGVMNASPSPDRPAPSTLVYLMDRDDGAAAWATDASRTDEDPGVAWAAGQVGAFSAGDPWGAEPLQLTYRTTSAEAVEVPLPTMWVLDDSVATDRLRIGFRSEIGAELVTFGFTEEGPYLTSVNGKARPGPEAPLVADHWGTPEDGVILEFQRSGLPTTFELQVAEHLLRPAELVGQEPFQRPPELAPNINRLSDRAIVRATVVVDLEAGVVTVGGQSASADGRDEGLAETPDSLVASPVDSAEVPDTIAPDTVGAPEVRPDTTGTGDVG